MKKKIYCRPESVLTRIQAESAMLTASPITISKDENDVTDTSWSNRGGWSSEGWTDMDGEE